MYCMGTLRHRGSTNKDNWVYDLRCGLSDAHNNNKSSSSNNKKLIITLEICCVLAITGFHGEARR